VIDWSREGHEQIIRPMARMPEWMVEKARGRMGVTSEFGSNVTPILPHREVSDFEKNYAKRALQNAWAELRSCKAGRRNHLLNVLAFKMGRLIARGWIDRGLVENLLMRASADCGLLAEDGEEQCLATLASGIEAGMLRPYHDISPPTTTTSLKYALSKK
jgi:hypothetical protein